MSLHSKIMNLQHGDPLGINAAENLMFKYGFKEARHAASEAALPFDALADTVRGLIRTHDERAKAANFARCGCEFCKPLRAAISKAEQA